MKVNARIPCSSSIVPAFGPGQGIEVEPPTDLKQKAVFEAELQRWIESGALELVPTAPKPEVAAAAKKKG